MRFLFIMIHPSGSPAAVAKELRIGRLTLRLFFLFALFLLTFLFTCFMSSAIAQEDECPGIEVVVQNIEHSTGTINCALFASEEGFPREVLRLSHKVILSRIEKEEARCFFVDVTPGTYAVVVLHDEDMDGELDTGFLGLPEEGIGFSSGAEIHWRPPSFSDASFEYNGGRKSMTISLSY